MRHARLSALAVLATALTSAPLAAQSVDTLSQFGRNSITLGIGLMGTRETSANGSQATAHASGQVGSISFTHFVRPQLAVEISAVTLDADARTTATSAYSEAVTPVLFGLNYSPAKLALTRTIRPYVSVAIGPYFHSIENASAFNSAESAVQTAFGGRFGAGANWYVSNHFLLQLEGDYHAVSKFDEFNGTRKDPSGVGMSFGLGFTWGRKQ